MKDVEIAAKKSHSEHSHIPALDGIRGLAILLVLVLHASNRALSPPDGALGRAVFRVVQCGWTGVDLFFVLSGFLITSILLRTKENSHYFRNFYARRILRIFPLYYVSLFLGFMVIPLFISLSENYVSAIDLQFWYWTHTQNLIYLFKGWSELPGKLWIGHYWSLAVEEQFYLFWPLAVFILSRKSLLLFCGFVAVCSPVARFLLQRQGVDPNIIEFTTVTHADPLCLGAALAIFYSSPYWERCSKSVLLLSLISSALALGALVLIERGFPVHGKFMQTVGIGTLGVFFAALIANTLKNGSNGILSKIFAFSALRALGKYSYCLYIVHLPLMSLIKKVWIQYTLNSGYLASFVGILVLGSLLSLGIALISWNVLEKRLLNLKRYF